MDLKDTIKAGWFQWYDIREYIEYPECHVLTYKLTDDCFYSQVLDFDIIASGETAIRSFDNVMEVALTFLKEYKERDGKIDFQSLGPEYWNRFRELHHKNKLKHFLSQNNIDNKGSFPFKYVHRTSEAYKIIHMQDKIIDMQDEIMEQEQKDSEVLQAKVKEQDTIIEQNQKDMEVLRARVRERDALVTADLEKAEILEAEFY